MKKIIALVLCLVMVFALCACGESNTATTAPAADTATEAPAEEPAAAGSVYYLNFKPESDEAWQALAETYTKQTGVPVTVVTAASGTYDQTLTSEMDKSEAPTMFQVGNPGAVVLDGRISGVWTARTVRDRLELSVTAWQAFSARQQSMLEIRAQEYAAFRGLSLLKYTLEDG